MNAADENLIEILRLWAAKLTAEGYTVPADVIRAAAERIAAAPRMEK